MFDFRMEFELRNAKKEKREASVIESLQSQVNCVGLSNFGPNSTPLQLKTI